MICISGRVLHQANVSLTWIAGKESRPRKQFLDLSQSAAPEPSEWKAGQSPFRKEDPAKLSNRYTLNFSLVFSEETNSYLPMRLCIGERKVIFDGLLDLASKVILIPGDPKHHCGLLVRISGLLAINVLFRSISQWVPWVPKPIRVPECVIWRDIFNKWQNLKLRVILYFQLKKYSVQSSPAKMPFSFCL